MLHLWVIFDSEDFNDAIGFDSDVGSGAELEWNTWDDACAWESRNASGDFPPDSAIALPTLYVAGKIVDFRSGTSVILELTLIDIDIDI